MQNRSNSVIENEICVHRRYGNRRVRFKSITERTPLCYRPVKRRQFNNLQQRNIAGRRVWTSLPWQTA